MPITSTTNALATITSVTNTLPTITNGTNIYLQQQITTTDLSSVSISNLITETTAITSWNDPALLVSGFVALIMLYTVRKMSAQNKISAESVNEMKRQYEQKEERDQLRDEKRDLREYIDKNLTSKTEEIFQNSEEILGTMSVNVIYLFNLNSCRHFMHLANNSQGLFYQKNITSIFNKISKYTHISIAPKDIYSSTVKKMYAMFFITISDSLYSALTNENSLKELSDNIDDRINNLEKVLTTKERVQLEQSYVNFQQEEALFKQRQSERETKN